MYAATFECKSMPCLWLGWVQSMRMLGACMQKRLGACMRLLGASFIRLKACLTVGSYSLHAYPTSGPRGPQGPRAQNINTTYQLKEYMLK